MFEYLFLITIFLVAGTMYGMYKYLRELVDEHHAESAELIRRFTATYKDTMDPIVKEARARFDVLERSIRDNDEHWSICLGNAKQSINEDIAAIGRDMLNLEERLLKKMLQNKYGTEEGRITVVIPEHNEEKRNARKRPTK